jgi:hypothetical protein
MQPVSRVGGGVSPPIHSVRVHNNDPAVSIIRPLAPAWETRKHWTGRQDVPCLRSCQCRGDNLWSAFAAAAIVVAEESGKRIRWRAICWNIPQTLQHLIHEPRFVGSVFQIARTGIKSLPFRSAICSPSAYPAPAIEPFDVRAYLAQRIFRVPVEDLVTIERDELFVSPEVVASPIAHTPAPFSAADAEAARQKIHEYTRRAKGGA